MRIGVLAHDQPATARPRTFIGKEDADFLLAHLAAESISKKLIRAFPPDSPFRRLTPPKSQRPRPEFICLAPVELPGLCFQPPKNQAERSMGVIRWHWEHSEIQVRGLLQLGS